MPTYPEIYDGPARSYRRDGDGDPITSRKRYITIHNTSNDATAEGEASYAKRRTDGTSSHYYCDHDSIVQSLSTDWCAGHVGSLEGNTYGISYEITGVNGWSRQTWLSSVAWDKLAACIARDCAQFAIPVRRLTIAEMRTRAAAGFITHNDARLAWGATDHTDPGPGFPMDHLLALVQQRLDGTGDDMTPEQHARLVSAEYHAYATRTGASPDTYVDGNPNAKANDGNPLHAKLDAISLKLDLVAAKVDIDPAELEAVKAAAAAGSTAGVAASAQQLATAIAAELADVIGLTPAEAEAAAERAVRKVLGGLDESST